MYLLFIGFFGLRQIHPFINTEANLQEDTIKPKTSYVKSGLNEEIIAEIHTRLLGIMEKERPFLQEDLNLEMLSKLLEVKSNHLSQVINQKSEMNFFNFVNSYRIEEVKRKISDSAFYQYSLLGIAFESGFRSKSSFNKLFKQHVGMTPTEYKKSLKK